MAQCAIFFKQPTATEKQMEKELPSHSKTFLSVDDYLRIEETALRKSEYLNGEMTEMPGVSREHTLIVTNFVYTLESQLIDRPYEVYSSELRLKVSATGLYTYPDVIVSEAEPAFELYGPRPLFLFPAADDELARERELDRLYQEQAKGKPVDEWPSVLRERDFELPSAYAAAGVARMVRNPVRESRWLRECSAMHPDDRPQRRAEEVSDTESPSSVVAEIRGVRHPCGSRAAQSGNAP